MNESCLPPPDAPVHPQLTHFSTSLSTHTILWFSLPCASLPLYLDQASVPQLQVAETPGLKNPTSVHLSTHQPDPFMQIQLSFLRSHAHLLRILPTSCEEQLPTSEFVSPRKHALPVGIPHCPTPGHLSLLVSKYYGLHVTAGKFTG